MNLNKIRKQLDYLVKQEWLNNYKLNANGELWLYYSVYDTENVETYTDYLITNNNLIKVFKKLAREVGENIENSADSCSDFYGYNTKEEMELRIAIERTLLNRIAVALKESE